MKWTANQESNAPAGYLPREIRIYYRKIDLSRISPLVRLRTVG